VAAMAVGFAGRRRKAGLYMVKKFAEINRILKTNSRVNSLDQILTTIFYDSYQSIIFPSSSLSIVFFAACKLIL
jgi:hypothetical protein